jgi:elongation factor G
LSTREYAPSEVVPLEGDAASLEKTARFSMLETLADHDDELMEQLLEDIEPPRDKVFDDLTRELREGLVCPVLMGTATRANGVLRLLKALRHESPGIAETAKRLGVKAGNDAVGREALGQEALGYVLKTLTRPMAAKCRSCACWPARPATARPSCPATTKPAASPASSSSSANRPKSAGRQGSAKPSHSPSSTRRKPATHSPPARQAHAALAKVVAYPPVLAIAISAKERKDDVKLGLALAKLVEEDPSITIVHNAETHEVVLWGQGEMHLRVATERLNDRFGVAIERRQPSVGYRETIRKGVVQRGRHKKAIRRPRPVRRRRARHQAAAARLRFRVRGKNHRRRGAAQLYSRRSRKASSTRFGTARSVFRWSISRWR